MHEYVCLPHPEKDTPIKSMYNTHNGGTHRDFIESRLVKECEARVNNRYINPLYEAQGFIFI